MLWAGIIRIAAAHATAANDDVPTLEEKRTVEKAVCNYFLANPDIVFDALKILDSRRRASKAIEPANIRRSKLDSRLRIKEGTTGRIGHDYRESVETGSLVDRCFPHISYSRAVST
jgi:hypothetical protein